MSYRPQFAYALAPDGWEDQEFEYFFDTLNALPPLIAPGQEFQNIVLQLHRDADFHWRAVQTSRLGGGAGLGLRFRTPDGSRIEDAYVPAWNLSGYPGAAAGIPGGTPVPLQDEIVCPAGSVILLDILALT